MSRSLRTLFSVIMLLVIILPGCSAPPQPTQAPLPSAPLPTAPPTAEAAQPTESTTLVLATTTSTENSGLLAYLLPGFQEEYGVSIEVIAVGTGQAIALGEDGNADVLMVHARAREDAFMDAGHGVRREDLMYNDFVIVGPSSDPAGIKGMQKAPEALAKIADAQASFVSRGDDSGTHTKEKAIWADAGVEVSGDWYISVGQGMGAVLTMADEEKAYTISDRATYLARTLEGTELVILVEGDPILFNPYGVIAVNPDKNPQINNDLANQFIDWLVSLPTQEKIAGFGVEKFHALLFTPDSKAWREASRGVEELPGDVGLKITGNVGDEVGWSEEDVRAMDTMEAQSTNKAGETETYTGVSLNRLLEMAAPADSATAVVFVADDGYTAEIALAELMGCDDCIVSFRDEGGFSIIAPGFPGTVQVKGVIELQVK